ncbi:efflux RND transporter periplasmic adaptor subunit [Caenimonas aquaedulcis]|uniref:Efflux RND transporter periplasmic adaptor subunit n=1 Tax=Caenimonas aquaedulcis TaxID=2793270 RepID=A0A931H287_9BURK|nr:efflux RND transporter periplasmic adaptor subunit [Caenimonas aquaedulcis]MBG9387164.1 efflux RND transporter periplasmic adaptor subunit [Caenimonas aquaedulcis]
MALKALHIAAGAAGIALVAGAAWWYHASNAPVSGAVAADGRAAGAPAPGASGSTGPAALVTLAVAQKQDVPVDVTVNGSVMSLNSVDVRPQVSNMIQKVHVKEGDFVKAGQPLFTLDSRADQANLAKAKAQQQKDEATLADLERQYKRSQELLAQNFIAKSATETVLAQVEAQRATVAADRAAVQSAAVALSFDEIRAPIAGRTGAIAVFAGTLAQPATSLVTITQLDPIAVSFPVPEGRLQDLLQASKARSPVLAMIPGKPAPLRGALSFVDNTVDPQVGTVRAKAQFDNGEHLLWPGQYVNTSVTVRTIKDAVVVPLAAIITSPNGRIVYVVKDDAVQPRKVEIDYSFADKAVVKGLQPGERIVLEGKQNLRPGSRVRIEKPSGAPAAKGAASGARGAASSAGAPASALLAARRDPT